MGAQRPPCSTQFHKTKNGQWGSPLPVFCLRPHKLCMKRSILFLCQLPGRKENIDFLLNAFPLSPLDHTA